MRQAELLAPAGSFQSLRAAFAAGADAVYTGGTLFGARAYADNLNQESLLEAIEEAHLAGKKLYLTVNTLLKEEELKEQLYGYLKPYYEAGLDGVLVQDFGVLSFVRREFPELPIHASTQMALTGPAGARFLEGQGVKRLVAARELSLEELARIHENTSAELEAFVHGALCYSYSGQCLMSSLIGGRSGNRGRCAQPCRLPYQVFEKGRRLNGKNTAYPLNTKDMCTLELIPRILRAGVYSLKIEGRMKKPEYTAGVVEIYRKYLDLYLEDQDRFDRCPEAFRAEPGDLKRLFELFNRDGFNQSYFLVRNGREMMALRNEKLTGKNGGNGAQKERLPEIRRKSRGIEGELYLAPEEPACLKVSLGEVSAESIREGVQPSKTQPLTEDRVRRQIQKTGNSPFFFEKLQIHLRGEVFVPLQLLNELRREALEKLQEALLEKFRRKMPEKREKILPDPGAKKKAGTEKIWALPETEEQFESLLGVSGIDGFYLPVFPGKGKNRVIRWHSAAEKAVRAGREVRLALPYITRADGRSEELRELIAREKSLLSGILVRNLESLAILMEMGLQGLAVLDAGMYTWNDQAVKFWRELGVKGNTAPLELNRRELSRRDNRDSELILYGRAPMMITAQCLKKNLDRCAGSFSRLLLRDRKGAEFPVQCDCGNCGNIIYNSLPLDLAGEWEDVRELGFSAYRLQFTVETGKEAAKTAQEILAVLRQKKGPECRSEFNGTKGHFRRGVE